MATRVGATFLEECDHLPTPELPAQDRLLVPINTMELEDVLGRVHPNAGNLVHGRPPHLRSATTSAWHSDAVRGPSTPTAIRDLRRRRCSHARGLGVGSRTVTADDGHALMGGEPVPHRCRRAAQQQIDDASPLQITDDGAVIPAPPPSPIIDADHPRRRRRHDPATAAQAQDGVAADRPWPTAATAERWARRRAPCRYRFAPRLSGRCGGPCAAPSPGTGSTKICPGNGRSESGAPAPATSPPGPARASP